MGTFSPTTTAWADRHFRAALASDADLLRLPAADRVFLARLWRIAPRGLHCQATAAWIREQFTRVVGRAVCLSIVYAAQPWDVPSKGDPGPREVAALAGVIRESRIGEGVGLRTEDQAEAWGRRARYRGPGSRGWMGCGREDS